MLKCKALFEKCTRNYHKFPLKITCIVRKYWVISVEHLFKIVLAANIRHRIMRETADRKYETIITFTNKQFCLFNRCCFRTPTISMLIHRDLYLRFFHLLFFASITMRCNGLLGEKRKKGEGKKRKRENVINVHFFLSYDLVKEDYSVSVAREYLDYIEY